MTECHAKIAWKRDDGDFAKGKYSRAHEMSFDGGVTVPASSSPSVVRVPLSREDAVDPEEMLVASLSSCHMLTFLDVARRAGFVIDSYVDCAEGILGKNDEGRISLTKVTLKPDIAWSEDKRPDAAQLHDLHHRAHEMCFIANSFRGEVVVEE